MSEHTPNPADREPLARPATWTALVAAVVATLAGFGLPVPEQVASGLVGLAAVAGPLVVWRWGRRRAWSGASVADRDRR